MLQYAIARALAYCIRWAEAIDAYKRLIQSAPEDVWLLERSWSALGDIYRALRRYTEAIEAYKNLIEISAKEDLPAIYLDLGKIYIEAKQDDEAIRAFDEANKIIPGYVRYDLHDGRIVSYEAGFGLKLDVSRFDP